MFSCRYLLRLYELYRSMPVIMEFFGEHLSSTITQGVARQYRGALTLLLGKGISRDEELNQLIKTRFRVPTGPRNFGTWDADLLFNYLEKWYPNNELRKDQLSKKVVALLALSTCHTYLSLAQLKLDDIKIEAEGVRLACKRKRTREVYITYYREDPRICPVVCLLDYLRMTDTRRPPDCPFVLINVKKSKGRASGQTITRWMHRMLTMCGVDMSVFVGPEPKGPSQFKYESVPFAAMRKQAVSNGAAAHFLQQYKHNW